MFSIRTSVIVFAATVFGVLTGGLNYLDSHSPLSAVLYGMGAFGASIVVLHSVIERDAPRGGDGETG
ncbi:hypothetical protein [Glycomyces niveus]|uniref:DUF2964 family protein n=1 Tax=Glycomyces niveus TaxID=2820287 RepID=A0ABS3U1V6_9ACTN|nr:hypothetical protein [Glycomyces sp. NEAU-S30]MBO3732765.1 hypothetical protein [Glycomyces sp. NEAU-S30]